MWRQFLSPRWAQVLTYRCIISGIIFCIVCSLGIRAQDSTEVLSDAEKAAIESVTEALSSQTKTDTEEVPPEEDTAYVSGTVVEDSAVDRKKTETVIKASKTLGKKERFRKKILSFIQFTGTVIRNKLKDPLARVSLISLHRKKIIILAVSVLVILFTLSYYRKKKEQGRFLTTTRLSIMDKEVQRACRHIEEHYDNPECNLRSVCAELVTGEAFLDALFVKELGLSISDFIDQVRINRAKITMRKEPDSAVGSLASSVGYTDTDFFLTSFKKITGTPYPEYKKTLVAGTDTSDA